MSRERPLWVRIALWQIGTRGTAVAFMVGSLVLATAGVLIGLVSGPPVLLGFAAFYGSAAWYWGAIRWVDSRAAW